MDILDVLPGQGLMFAGQPHPDSPEYDEMLACSQAWLTGGGMSEREATHYTTWRPGLVANDVWIRDHAHGSHCDDGCAGGIDFVQAHHDGARPVTVVHVPVPADPEPGAA